MARLCERPGCSAVATVAYGMDGDQLLVWLEPAPDDGDTRLGVVCRRHADAMVVPRGWTLDDRRESRPRLFRISTVDETPSRPRPSRARRAGRGGDGEQLSLMAPELTAPEPADDEGLPEAPAAEDEITVGDIRPLGPHDADETQAMPWRFQFDQDDDLGGLLQSDSPLLSRAFRGQRPRP